MGSPTKSLGILQSSGESRSRRGSCDIVRSTTNSQSRTYSWSLEAQDESWRVVGNRGSPTESCRFCKVAVSFYEVTEHSAMSREALRNRGDSYGLRVVLLTRGESSEVMESYKKSWGVFKSSKTFCNVIEVYQGMRSPIKLWGVLSSYGESYEVVESCQVKGSPIKLRIVLSSYGEPYQVQGSPINVWGVLSNYGESYQGESYHVKGSTIELWESYQVMGSPVNFRGVLSICGESFQVKGSPIKLWGVLSSHGESYQVVGSPIMLWRVLLISGVSYQVMKNSSYSSGILTTSWEVLWGPGSLR